MSHGENLRKSQQALGQDLSLYKGALKGSRTCSVTKRSEGGITKKLINLATAAALLFALSACATSSSSSLPSRSNPAAGYSFTHKDFDLRYAWNTTRSESGLRIEGLVKNVRYPKVDNLEVKVMLVSKSHQVLADGVAFPVPQPIDIGDYRSFGVLLKGAEPMPGDQLQFVASYAANAAQGSFTWTSNFAVDALTGRPVGPKESDTEW